MDQASNGRGGKSASASSAGALTEAASDTRLLTLVEAEIIPRLMQAHRDPASDGRERPQVHPEDVVNFVHALLHQQMDVATGIVVELCERGLRLDAVYLELFAPAARHLGELWEGDLCNFSQVTLCLWRLQTMLYDLSPAFQGSPGGTVPQAAAERRILMATLPGQQHTYGLSMLSEFFRREGWIALAIPSPKKGELQDSLSTHWFDVLALSASMDSEADELGHTIRAARKTSRNPRLAIMVGGPLFLRQPALAATVGADGYSEDAPAALAMAAQLVQQQQEVRLN